MGQNQSEDPNGYHRRLPPTVNASDAVSGSNEHRTSSDTNPAQSRSPTAPPPAGSGGGGGTVDMAVETGGLPNVLAVKGVNVNVHDLNIGQLPASAMARMNVNLNAGNAGNMTMPFPPPASTGNMASGAGGVDAMNIQHTSLSPNANNAPFHTPDASLNAFSSSSAGKYPGSAFPTSNTSSSSSSGGSSVVPAVLSDDAAVMGEPAALADQMRSLVGDGEEELVAQAAASGMNFDENNPAWQYSNLYATKTVETVPTLFKWSHGGAGEVYLTGSFNNWQGKIMMYKNEDGEFVLIIDIPPGIHHYKYIVDSEWRLDEEAPTVVQNGVENNIIEVKRPVFEYTPASFDSDEEDGGGSSSGSDSESGSSKTVASAASGTPGAPSSTQPAAVSGGKKGKALYGQRAPQSSDYVQDPPKLPPQLQDVHLNTIQSADPLMLPNPQHVTLNHLYLLNGTDPSVLVTSITQRFRPNKNALASHKFVTTIFVCPRPTTTNFVEAHPTSPLTPFLQAGNDFRMHSSSPALSPNNFPSQGQPQQQGFQIAQHYYHPSSPQTQLHATQQLGLHPHAGVTMASPLMNLPPPNLGPGQQKGSDGVPVSFASSPIPTTPTQHMQTAESHPHYQEQHMN